MSHAARGPSCVGRRLRGRVDGGALLAAARRPGAGSRLRRRPGRPRRPLAPSRPGRLARPAALRARVPQLEMSGLAWAPTLDRYLVVVDDTIDLDDGLRHAPFVLALDRAGQARRRSRFQSWASRRSTTPRRWPPAPDDTFYLLTSHSPNRQGKVHKHRRQLLELEAGTAPAARQRRVDLLHGHGDILEQLEQLGLPAQHRGRSRGAGLPRRCALHRHEGAAACSTVRRQSSGSSNPTEALRAGKVAKQALSLWAQVKLAVPVGGAGGRREGVADLFFAPDGALYLCANAPKGAAQDGGGALWRVAAPRGGRHGGDAGAALSRSQARRCDGGARQQRADAGVRSRSPRSPLDDMAPRNRRTSLCPRGAGAGAGWRERRVLHAQPLDTRALLAELRRAIRSRAPAAAPAGAQSPGPGREPRRRAGAALEPPSCAPSETRAGSPQGEVATAGELSNPVLRAELTHLQERRERARLGPAPVMGAAAAGRVRAGRGAGRAPTSRRSTAQSASASGGSPATCGPPTRRCSRSTRRSGSRRRRWPTGASWSELVTQRVSKGGSTRFDLDLTQLSLVTAEPRRDASASSIARRPPPGPGALLGVGPPRGRGDGVGGLSTTTTAKAPAPSAADVEDRALADRPALAVTRARYQVAERRCGQRPPPAGPGSCSRRSRASGATSSSAGPPTSPWASTSPFPILDTNAGRIQSAGAMREAARADMVAAIAGVRSDVAQALAPRSPPSARCSRACTPTSSRSWPSTTA